MGTILARMRLSPFRRTDPAALLPATHATHDPTEQDDGRASRDLLATL